MSLDSYLAGCINGSPHVDQLLDASEPVFRGSMDEFREQHGQAPEVLDRLNNQVKVCKQCGKACAVTLKNCNSCGTSLDGIEVSLTDNIFMGFVYGIERGKFPFKISLRSQTPQLLCFDDPLSLSPCHFNVIPTKIYCRDLRFLFIEPREGLSLIRTMLQFAAQTAVDQFWANPAYHATMFRGEPLPVNEGTVDLEKIRPHLVIGMNFPPSMCQLHLQFIHMPHQPFHAHMAFNGNHYHKGRFFFFDFLEKALALGDRVKMHVTDDTPIEAIVDRCRSAGVDYDQIHDHATNLVKQHEERPCVYLEENFKYMVSKSSGVKSLDGSEPVADIDMAALQKADGKRLQNYGRPFKDGVPQGTYYKYAAANVYEVVNFGEPPAKKSRTDKSCCTSRACSAQ
eukprot:NODE_7280_length_1593_cov_10.690996.p1 GENE.NODE_7280_length_1593_cov_10.690996~~NODE_7280_length_1593_cov_10.690996.p1  ORF type:complete len:425 (+),score=104.54 NODE_7280_length_1593_cov_10.690996:86-1276(+)